MKKYSTTLHILATVLLINFLNSCGDRQKKFSKKEIKITENVRIIDISGGFFNQKIPLEEFKKHILGFKEVLQILNILKEEKTLRESKFIMKPSRD